MTDGPADLRLVEDGELEPDDGPATRELRSGYRLPFTVTVADDVDLDAEDPSLNPTGGRTCVSTRMAGGRCGATAVNGEVLCSIHSGRLNPADGAKAKHEARRRAEERADQALSLQKLGTRAVVAQTLVAEADNVRKTVQSLLERASTGDIRAATALIPWLNQGLGMPTERVEHQLPGTPDEVMKASTAALAELVAEGRRRRVLEG